MANQPVIRPKQEVTMRPAPHPLVREANEQNAKLRQAEEKLKQVAMARDMPLVTYQQSMEIQKEYAAAQIAFDKAQAAAAAANRKLSEYNRKQYETP